MVTDLFDLTTVNHGLLETTLALATEVEVVSVAEVEVAIEDEVDVVVTRSVDEAEVVIEDVVEEVAARIAEALETSEARDRPLIKHDHQLVQDVDDCMSMFSWRPEDVHANITMRRQQS